MDEHAHASAGFAARHTAARQGSTDEPFDRVSFTDSFADTDSDSDRDANGFRDGYANATPNSHPGNYGNADSQRDS